MSKALSVATVLEKNKLSSGTPFVVMLDIEVVDPNTGVVVEVLHVVRNNEDINYQGHIYVASNFDMQVKAETGAQPETTITIRDMTRDIQTRMQAYGGGVGFNITMMIVNAGNLTQPPEIEEFFQVTGATAQNYTVSFTLGAENALMVTFPRRRQTRNYCQWRYKDPDTCRYSGTLPTCDLSLEGPNGCTVHHNGVNFGAFPGIAPNSVQYG
jgi:phage-related protein